MGTPQILSQKINVISFTTYERKWTRTIDPHDVNVVL